jgi:hypothetical protein
MNFYFQLIIPIVCLLASITVYFQPETERYLKLFPVYLLIVNVVGPIGKYMGDHSMNNTLLYNIYSIIEFVFYLFVLHEIIRNKKVKKIIVYILYICLPLAILDMYGIQKANVFHSMSYALNSLALVGICVFYFYELFQLPQTNSLLREPAFWICTSILFSTCCNFPLFAFAMFFNAPPQFIINNILTILFIINIFSFSLYTIAFLCRIKTSKFMSSS